jgi:hypothetical protein
MYRLRLRPLEEEWTESIALVKWDRRFTVVALNQATITNSHVAFQYGSLTLATSLAYCSED